MNLAGGPGLTCTDHGKSNSAQVWLTERAPGVYIASIIAAQSAALAVRGYCRTEVGRCREFYLSRPCYNYANFVLIQLTAWFSVMTPQRLSGGREDQVDGFNRISNGFIGLSILIQHQEG